MVCCLVSFSQVALAQSTYLISDSKSNDMKLSGTSSLHDWDMNAHAFTGKAEFDFKKDDDQILVGLNSLTFSLPVINLKSDKKGLDKNAYEALHTGKYKNIAYTLLTAKVTPQKDNKFLVKATGNLTIAGVTKETEMDVHCVVNTNGTITCTGSDKLNMTDYNVKPPTFMLGAMKTGDGITLEFNVVYKTQKGA